MENKIIVLCAKSGAGKDSISEEFKKLGYNFIVSTSTRPMREGEKQGDPYDFVSKEEFESLIRNDRLVEYRTYNTIQNGKEAVWYYGITKDSIKPDEKYVVVLDMQGLLDLKEVEGDRITSFYINVSDKERERRAKLRGGFEQAEWDRRLIDDNKVFSKKAIKQNVDHKIKNYNFEKCLNQIKEVVIDMDYRIEKHFDGIKTWYQIKYYNKIDKLLFWTFNNEGYIKNFYTRDGYDVFKTVDIKEAKNVVKLIKKGYLDTYMRNKKIDIEDVVDFDDQTTEEFKI